MTDEIKEALRLIFEGINLLHQASLKARKFTIDGRLVGDIGEIIAEREFDIILDKVSRPYRDAETPDGRSVQIKATFQNSLTFSVASNLYLGLKLNKDGSHEVIYNGPAELIANEYKHRKGIGEKLLSFPISRLKAISANVSDTERVPLRIK